MDAPKIMVFRPTWAEFQDFTKYIEYMESQGAHLAGVAKVIPPPEWHPRPDRDYGPLARASSLLCTNQEATTTSTEPDPVGDITIPAPIDQQVTGKHGQYQLLNVQRRPLTVRQLHKIATSRRHAPPAHKDLERTYWRELPYVSPTYGADVPGTLTDAKMAGAWNPNRLSTLLDLVSSEYGVSIGGVNTAFLYFGMWKTSFAWHIEDMDLYSINFLHFGAPKTWYAVPPSQGRRLERLADRLFPAQRQGCAAHLRHKMTLISPNVLRRNGVWVERMEQVAGEFVVTFPYGYHSGFNQGFNCAESANFATQRWIEYGKRASRCACQQDAVRINMNLFVKKYQPERFESWMMGLDVGRHPEDKDGPLLGGHAAHRQPVLTAQMPPALISHICSPRRRHCPGSLPAEYMTESLPHICSPTKRKCSSALPPLAESNPKKKRRNV